jgi:transposase
MPITNEQWHLIKPLLPDPSPFVRGRPPFDRRLVMVGVLCKLCYAIPWYDLSDYYPPEASSKEIPSWQTCYRAYRLWGRQGVMDQVYRLLYQDLCDRGGIDLFQLLEAGLISLEGDPSGKTAIIPFDYLGTWQGTTLQLLCNVILLRGKKLVPTTERPQVTRN